MVRKIYRYYKMMETNLWPKSRLTAQLIKLVLTAMVMLGLMFEFVPGFGESPYNFF